MTDSHAHLDMPAFGPDRAAVLARAARAGVSTVVSIGMLDGEASWENTFALVDALHPDGADHGDAEAPQLFTTLGCHPHDARLFGELGGRSGSPHSRAARASSPSAKWGSTTTTT